MGEVKHKIHYIGAEQRSCFIIAKTTCGKNWEDVTEFSSDANWVSCKKCLKRYANENKYEITAKLQEVIRERDFLLSQIKHNKVRL